MVALTIPIRDVSSFETIKKNIFKMAVKNKKTKGHFTSDQIRNWENKDGVNFAIALARITGWLLHVDWLTIDQHAKVKDMTPLRVYVGIDTDYIFDFNGKKHIRPTINMWLPQLQQRG